MVATLEVDGAPQQFAAVAALGPHGQEAAGKLRELHGELLRLGAHNDAQRLLGADKAAQHRDFAMLERLSVTDHLLDEVSDIQHARVRWIVGARNASALLPLLLTWFLLGWASWSYNHQLVNDPGQSTEPFLALWQRRFGDAFIPTFAETAFAAFVLLAVILALTAMAHWVESDSNRLIGALSAKADDAMNALLLAAEASTIRPPISAADWAEAAQRVFAQTQDMLTAAVSSTAKIAERNNQISETAQKVMIGLQAQVRELITDLAQETRETMGAVRTDNAQFIARTGEEAKLVLQQAAAANQQLVERHMTPLFEGFSASLEDYRADQKVYRDSAAGLAGGVSELSKSAAVLAGSSQSYKEIAASIDTHLELIEGSQSKFVAHVAGHSESIATAAKALHDVAATLTSRISGDLEALARNVVHAGAGLAAADESLAQASAALKDSTRAMQEAATQFAALAAAAPGPSRWRRMLSRMAGPR